MSDWAYNVCCCWTHFDKITNWSDDWRVRQQIIGSRQPAGAKSDFNSFSVLHWQEKFHQDKFAYVSSNGGVRWACFNTSLHVSAPGQACGLNTTTSSKTRRASPHIVRRHAVVFKDRFQATSLNKYLVIFVGRGLNVICRTNTTVSSRSKHHACYPASQYRSGCRFQCIRRINALLSVGTNVKIRDNNKSIHEGTTMRAAHAKSMKGDL